MNIYIVANFCREFTGVVDGRFLYLAEYLSARGHEVRLISSNFSHSRKEKRIAPLLNAYKSQITLCNEPGYSNNVSLKRLWSHRVWGNNVEKCIKVLPKPDVIYCAIPSLTAAHKMALYCKRNRIKFVVDVQDLWPEAFCMVVKNKLLRLAFKPMEWYVNSIYHSADMLVAVSDTYLHRMQQVNKHCKHNVSVCLGNVGDVYDTITRKDYKDSSIDICYIGSLSYSYDLKCIIDALSLIEKKKLVHKAINFHVLGDGALRSSFEEYAKEKAVTCNFYGMVSYEKMAKFIAKCDMAVNPIVEGSAASVINKVGDYAMAGLPVVNTQECLEYRDMLDEYQAGINCRVGNAQDVAEAIALYANNDEMRTKASVKAKQLGKERFDRRYTYNTIVEELENLVR